MLIKLLVLVVIGLAAGGVRALRWPGSMGLIAPRDAAPDEDPFGPGLCDLPDYRKNLLKVVRQVPYIGLFEKLHGARKFEASGMSRANGSIWVVFDNLHALARIEEHFGFRSPDHKLMGALGNDSGFEGLAYVKSTHRFIAVQEQVDQGRHAITPMAVELELDHEANNYKVLRRCPVNFYFRELNNKGFEGVWVHEYSNGTTVMLGLCEGNYCKAGRRGRDRGHGVVVVATPALDPDAHDDDCHWDVLKTLDVPRTAFFMDYSDMSFKGERVAITSQEDSAVYITWFNWDTLEFEPERGEDVVYFPRDVHCEHMWCNVEGVEWLDASRLVITSDKAKARQHYRCTTNDQSIAIVALPTPE